MQNESLSSPDDMSKIVRLAKIMNTTGIGSIMLGAGITAAQTYERIAMPHHIDGGDILGGSALAVGVALTIPTGMIANARRNSGII